MITEHLKIGTIQALLDSELSLDESAQVTGHIAGCDACAALLAEAEDESAIVFPALASEFDTLVPTQRLWSRINESIAAERQPAWARLRSFLAAAFISPSIAAAAGLLIVIGIAAAVWMNRGVTVEEPRATLGTQPSVTAPVMQTPPARSTVGDIDTGGILNAPRIERAAYRHETRRSVRSTVPSDPARVNLPGEESYVKTIASLTKTVDEQKEAGVLRPSQRVAFERDMAVVNDAIAKMKKEVRRNPQNGSARQVLYASYQNKIDLLNSVSQQEELIASIK
ncbi:MAG: zf-HC2 domain-containing protein [Chloracidobacterium sp.]|nr:zf-HC2 domain-containing protein [Chloracidobacterium sp.]